MNRTLQLLLILCGLSIVSLPGSGFSGNDIRKGKTQGMICVAVPGLITSRATEFIPRQKDTLAAIIAEGVKHRLDSLGFSWIEAPEELNGRILRNFKPKLKEDHDPVDSISYATADLVGSLKVKYLVIIYTYLDSDHRGAMMASGMLEALNANLPSAFITNAIATADIDDDLYLFCSMYDVQTQQATMSAKYSISKNGKASTARFREEVKTFVGKIFR